jgi:hypothetical protein
MSAIGSSGTGNAEGTGVPENRGPGRPRGSGKKEVTATAVAAPSSAPHRGRPPGSRNKKTLAALAAAATGSAGPVTEATSSAGPSRLWPVLPPVHQPPAYALAEGWVTFLVRVLVECEDRLCLPSKFVEPMEG